MAVEALDRSGSTTPAALEEGVPGWLAWMSQLLGDCAWLGVVEFSANAEQESVVHGFPQSIQTPLYADPVARRACLSGKAVNVRLEQNRTSAAEQCVLAVPLNQTIDGSYRALLLMGAAQSSAQTAATIKLCRWASVWLDQTAKTENIPTATGSDSLAEAVLNAFEKQGSAQSVAMAIASSLKRLCGCKRVGIASTMATKGAKGLNLIALSDQVQLDTRRILPAQILSAMRECVSGAGICAYPYDKNAQNNTIALPAHEALFEAHGSCPSLSLFFPAMGASVQSALASKMDRPTTGHVSIVLLLERPPGQPFTAIQIAAIQTLLIPALSVLCSLAYREMNLGRRLIDHLRQMTTSGFWQQLNMQQWSKIALTASLLATLVIPVPHRVGAQAAIQAKDLQVLAAPQGGFVAGSYARAGDSVKKGQLLATLDTRELQLSVDKWRSEVSKNRQALDQALAVRDRVSLAGLRADAARIAAELSLTERQLARTELRAPFDGVVLSGDLSQSLGVAVAQGDKLFTIASSDEYELVLNVEEKDIGLVNTGQTVRVRMAALPNETWHASVDAVLPVAVSTKDTNVFRVPAQLTEPSSRLRPGMEGVAKLYVGSRSMAWVYTRALREQFRLMLWRLGVIR